MSAPREVGSAAEEAARLLAAAEQWARTRGSTLLDAEHLATGTHECTVCPLCQTLGRLRQVRPEVATHLLDAAGSLVAALKAAVPVPEPAAPPAPRVQRIDVDEA